MSTEAVGSVYDSIPNNLKRSMKFYDPFEGLDPVLLYRVLDKPRRS